jgi:GNAT superfamily N-acetyltransferase
VIRELRRDELAGAGELLGAAFRDDPAFAHILPDDAARRRRLPSLLTAMLRVDAARGGSVRGAFDGSALVGAASVMPAGGAEPALSAWFAHAPSLAWLLADPAGLLRALGLARAVARLRPRQPRYLHLLGVHPACQGRGVGAALLKHAFEGGPLYLETFLAANAAWYEARGMERLMEARSADRPTFWTLRRG